MFKTVQEIGVYIHRFHNLDLFQQGWYQIKISMRCEDSDTLGTPARVVQYEAPELGYDDIYGVWRIDERDNSFSTQPFRIKYARQDILLSILISFTLSPGKYEGLPTSAVILKFELMHAPITEYGSELQASLDSSPAAVHEFRIPPKALLGLHSYCPVHFDAFHVVLVDVSIHVSLLKAGSHTPSSKVPRSVTDSSFYYRHAGHNHTYFVTSPSLSFYLFLIVCKLIICAIFWSIALFQPFWQQSYCWSKY